MINFDKLPKEPILAFRSILSDALAHLPARNTQISEFAKANARNFESLIIHLKAARAIAPRVGDSDLTKMSNEKLKSDISETSDVLRERIYDVLNTSFVLDMDRHFFSSDDVALFDEAIIPQNEREDIRAALRTASDLAAKANFMSDPLRRSFLHLVAKAENELFKEKVGIQAFFAVAYEASRFVKQFGQDAKPLAEAIENARTKTERRVEATQLIAEAEKPKQITDQS